MKQMKNEIKPIDFLKSLKESDFFIEYIYTNGGCYQLYKILKTIFFDAEPYIILSKTHVVTKIGDKFYDINGEYINNDNADILPMNEDLQKEAEEWSFANNNDLYFGECPYCEEPVKIDRSKLGKPISHWIDCSKQMPPERKEENNTLQGHREWTESNRVLVWDSLYGPGIDWTRNGVWVNNKKGGYQGQVVHGIIAWMPIHELDIHY